MTTGREFYEDWARRRGANRDYDAPRYVTLNVSEQRLWSELAAKVDGRKECRSPVDDKPDYLKNWGVNLQKPIRDVPSKDDVVKGFFEGARFDKGSSFDKLITQIVVERGKVRDWVDNAGDALKEALATMADDEGLHAALREAFAAVGNNAAVQNAFLTAFFDRVIDDSALFVS